MDDELEAQGVLDLILEYLGVFQVAGPDRPEGHSQLIEHVNAAVTDHPDDILRQAAAAVAVVTACGTFIDQEDFEKVLSQLRRIEGLASIRDVYYVDLDLRREREVSMLSVLSENLSEKHDIRLDDQERAAIDRFIGSALDLDFEPPESSEGGPRP